MSKRLIRIIHSINSGDGDYIIDEESDIIGVLLNGNELKTEFYINDKNWLMEKSSGTVNASKFTGYIRNENNKLVMEK